MRSIEQVRAAVRTAAPDLARADVRWAGQGECCEAWWVGEEHVVRFARDPVVDAELEREMAVLPALAEAIEVAIPRPEFIGRDPDTGRVFVGHRAVHGELLSPRILARLSARARGQLTAELGRFLDQLQAFARTSVGVELPEARYDAVLRDTEAIERAVFSRMPEADARACRSMLDALELDPADARVLAHCDLYEGHILIDPTSERLAGVIDFGDLAIGDPCYDLNTLIDDFGLRFTAEVVRHLPPALAAPRLARARIVCIWESLAWSAGQLAAGAAAEVDANLARLHTLIAAGTIEGP